MIQWHAYTSFGWGHFIQDDNSNNQMHDKCIAVGSTQRNDKLVSSQLYRWLMQLYLEGTEQEQHFSCTGRPQQNVNVGSTWNVTLFIHIYLKSLFSFLPHVVSKHINIHRPKTECMNKSWQNHYGKCRRARNKIYNSLLPFFSASFWLCL